MSDKVRYGGGLSSGMGSGMGGSGRRAGGLSGSVGGGYSSRPRGSSGMSQAGGGGSHRSRNQADLSLRNESIINGIDYSPRRSSKSTPRDRQLSTASSLARVPAPFQAAPSTPTTTNATKSRRSTLLSSAATTWEEEEGSRQDDYEELEPPPAAPSRYHSAWDYSHKNYAPSSPSSVVSSASPQLFPETPAQQESRRRSQEVNRMATIQSSSAHHRSGHSTTMHKPAQPTSMSALLPPPRTGDSIFGDGSEKGGSVTGGGRSGYQPMKWKNERAGLRGGVDDDYRPPPLDQTEWTYVLHLLSPSSKTSADGASLPFSSVPAARITSSEAGARSPLPFGSPYSVRASIYSSLLNISR